MKTFASVILHLLLFALPIGLQAQGWERVYREGISGQTGELVETPDGGFLLIGSAKASVNSDRLTHIFKLDPDGAEQWRLNLPASLHHFSTSGLVLSDDRYFLLGDSRNRQGVDTDLSVVEITSSGQFLQVVESPLPLDQRAVAIRQFQDGSIWALASTQVDDNGTLKDRSLLLRYQGSTLLQHYTIGEDYERPVDLVEASDGLPVILSDQGSTSSTFEDDLVLRKLDRTGTQIWTESYGGPFGEHGGALIPTSDGGYAICAYLYGGNHLHEDKGVLLYKTAADGTEEWNRHYPHFPASPGLLSRPGIAYDLVQTSDGGYVIAGETFDYPPFDAFLIRTSSDGSEQWRETYRGGDAYSSAFRSMQYLPGKAFVMAGQLTAGQPNGLWSVKTDTLGKTLSAFLEGSVTWDEDADCEADIWEQPLNDWKLILSTSTGQEQLLSIQNGAFQTDVDTGRYDIRLLPPGDYWDACPPQEALVTRLYDTTLTTLGADPIYSCPQLLVNVAAAKLEICESTAYTVAYCNIGTTPASDAYVELLFDEQLGVDSASRPFTSPQENRYSFDLGDIAPGDCGQFEVYVQLDCSAIPSQTHCVEAHIYPDSICLPPNAGWTGASLQLNALCDDDSLRLNIQNVGLGNMSTAQTFIIIEDDVILRSEPVDLPAGESLNLLELPAGATIRLEVPQEPNHPGQSRPSVVVEGCGGPPLSTGFVNQFAMDDDNDFVDIHCLQSRVGTPPNGLQAFPTGYGTEHWIDAGEPLEYLIHFQNTGTDTIQQLIIRDTISPHLHLGSLSIAASSHPHTYQLKSDSVLVLTFNQMALPPLGADRLRSQGFIKLNIDQQPNNEVGDVIRHQASLSFDYGAPLQTGEVFHTIGKDYVNEKMVSTTTPLGESSPLRIFPNPVHNTARIDLPKATSDGHWKLFDLSGRLLRERRLSGQTFQFSRGDLPSGIYMYELQMEGQPLQHGKLTIQ
ncbi:MAG: T9SS type A sorting domain-containing protein [Bacteroidota bacterium]